MSRNSLAEIFGLRSPQIAQVKDDQLVPTIIKSSRAIGVEVEVEGVAEIPMRVERRWWDVKEDGSLRNRGLEFVSYPVFANRVKPLLNDLYTAMGDNCLFSMRTSIHIHVNVQDFTKDEIKTLLLLYTLLERPLYRFIGRARDRNIFCLPLFSSNVLGIINGVNLGTIASRWSKYNGFNLAPIRSFGTVEFRHMAGTINTEQIENWINITTLLVDTAKNVPLSKLIESLSGMPYSHFRDEYLSLFGGLLTSSEAEFKNSLTLAQALFTQPPSSDRVDYSQLEAFYHKYKGAFA